MSNLKDLTDVKCRIILKQMCLKMTAVDEVCTKMTGISVSVDENFLRILMNGVLEETCTEYGYSPKDFATFRQRILAYSEAHPIDEIDWAFFKIDW